jgi:hypothetical protein
MDHTVTVLERAFQLAESGSCASVADITTRLGAEGYAVAQLTGRTLTKQLNALINAERGAIQEAARGQTPNLESCDGEKAEKLDE